MENIERILRAMKLLKEMDDDDDDDDAESLGETLLRQIVNNSDKLNLLEALYTTATRQRVARRVGKVLLFDKYYDHNEAARAAVADWATTPQRVRDVLLDAMLLDNGGKYPTAVFGHRTVTVELVDNAWSSKGNDPHATPTPEENGLIVEQLFVALRSMFLQSHSATTVRLSERYCHHTVYWLCETMAPLFSTFTVTLRQLPSSNESLTSLRLAIEDNQRARELREAFKPLRSTRTRCLGCAMDVLDKVQLLVYPGGLYYQAPDLLALDRVAEDDYAGMIYGICECSRLVDWLRQNIDDTACCSTHSLEYNETIRNMWQRRIKDDDRDDLCVRFDLSVNESRFFERYDSDEPLTARTPYFETYAPGLRPTPSRWRGASCTKVHYGYEATEYERSMARTMLAFCPWQRLITGGTTVRHTPRRFFVSFRWMLNEILPLLSEGRPYSVQLRKLAE